MSLIATAAMSVSRLVLALNFSPKRPQIRTSTENSAPNAEDTEPSSFAADSISALGSIRVHVPVQSPVSPTSLNCSVST
eukprot:Skav228885  [mRNA]  locus=scaffold2395:236054:236582:- [translate_table: standard]